VAAQGAAAALAAHAVANAANAAAAALHGAPGAGAAMAAVAVAGGRRGPSPIGTFVTPADQTVSGAFVLGAGCAIWASRQGPCMLATSRHCLRLA
jgi:hypothetical protein